MFGRVLQIALTTFLTLLSTGCMSLPHKPPVVSPPPPVVVAPPAFCVAPVVLDKVTNQGLKEADIYVEVLHVKSYVNCSHYLAPSPIPTTALVYAASNFHY